MIGSFIISYYYWNLNIKIMGHLKMLNGKNLKNVLQIKKSKSSKDSSNKRFKFQNNLFSKSWNQISIAINWSVWREKKTAHNINSHKLCFVEVLQRMLRRKFKELKKMEKKTIIIYTPLLFWFCVNNKKSIEKWFSIFSE